MQTKSVDLDYSTATDADRIRHNIGAYLVDNLMSADYLRRCLDGVRGIIRCESHNNRQCRYFDIRLDREYEIQQAERLEAELEWTFGHLLRGE